MSEKGKRELKLSIVTALSMVALLSWGANGPYKELGASDGGIWKSSSCKFSLRTPIGILDKGYVYTNVVGIVHQFNFTHPFAKDVTQDSAVEQLRSTESVLTKTFVLSSFKAHVDSNPNRYLWSEECSMLDYPRWSVRLYLVKDMKTGCFIAHATIWNAGLAQGSASSESRDDVVLDELWEYCQIKGDPFEVLKMGEAFPTNLYLNTRLGWHQVEGAHVRCFGTVTGFEDFNRFTVDVSSNDMKVLAVNLYSRSPVESENVDQWLTNCVELCNRHFRRLEWGLLRDRTTGERDAYCARRVGNTRFDNLFIALKPDVREEVDMINQHGLVTAHGSACQAILHVEIPNRYKREFGEPSPFFADRYLYRTVPVTSFERP